MRQRGMTLIEVIVVVMVIATMAAVLAVSLGTGQDGRQLRDAARELVAQLQYTRSVAMVSGESQLFAIDVDAHAWQAAGNRSGTLPRRLEVQALTADGEAIDPDTAGIRFFPDGTSTGGVIRLLRGEAVFRIEVHWLTGAVTVGRGGE
ncbi:MAG: GspH/FimT family pseudopilin [Lysobacteraceae bacterium]